MRYDVTIDKELFSVYPEIRLGLLRFHADVKAPDDHFWEYMNAEVLPQVRSGVEGKEWSEIPGTDFHLRAAETSTFVSMTA